MNDEGFLILEESESGSERRRMRKTEVSLIIPRLNSGIPEIGDSSFLHKFEVAEINSKLQLEKIPWDSGSCYVILIISPLPDYNSKKDEEELVDC
jgi:hypothetical protein